MLVSWTIWKQLGLRNVSKDPHLVIFEASAGQTVGCLKNEREKNLNVTIFITVDMLSAVVSPVHFPQHLWNVLGPSACKQLPCFSSLYLGILAFSRAEGQPTESTKCSAKLVMVWVWSPTLWQRFQKGCNPSCSQYWTTVHALSIVHYILCWSATGACSAKHSFSHDAPQNTTCIVCVCIVCV